MGSGGKDGCQLSLRWLRVCLPFLLHIFKPWGRPKVPAEVQELLACHSEPMTNPMNTNAAQKVWGTLFSLFYLHHSLFKLTDIVKKKIAKYFEFPIGQDRKYAKKRSPEVQTLHTHFFSMVQVSTWRIDSLDASIPLSPVRRSGSRWGEKPLPETLESHCCSE